MPDPDPQITEDDLAALTALADGHLPSAEAKVLRARLEREPALEAEYARQSRGVSILRAATADVYAPHSLRMRIEDDRAKAAAPRQRRRWWLPVGAASALSAAAIAIVLIVSVGGAPTVDDVLSAASHTATIGVSINNQTPQLLTTALDGVAFPNFAAKFGWKATGARTEEIGGRPITTVFYEKGGRKIAYSIVGGDALDVPGGNVTSIDGKDFTVLGAGERTLVTWERGGHTCVLSGEGIGAEELVALASWKGKGHVPF